MLKTPKSVRCLFRDPFTPVAREVSKALAELATSIKNRLRFSPDVLLDHLHEALQDLDTAIKSQPKLFVPTARTICSLIESTTRRLLHGDTLPSVKTDISALLLELRNTKGNRAAKGSSRVEATEADTEWACNHQSWVPRGPPLCSLCFTACRDGCQIESCYWTSGRMGKVLSTKDDIVIDMQQRKWQRNSESPIGVSGSVVMGRGLCPYNSHHCMILFPHLRPSQSHAQSLLECQMVACCFNFNNLHTLISRIYFQTIVYILTTNGIQSNTSLMVWLLFSPNTE